MNGAVVTPVELITMLRHAATTGTHHLAALNEIRDLLRRPMSGLEFRVRAVEILDAVQLVGTSDDDAATLVRLLTRDAR